MLTRTYLFLALALLCDAASKPAPAPAKSTPSAACAKYPHLRFAGVVNEWRSLVDTIAAARPGDLIELAANTVFHAETYAGGREVLPVPARKLLAQTDEPVPWGAVFRKQGGPGKKMITICGPRSAVIDGASVVVSNFRIVHSSYIRLAGMTFQNGGTGVDVQNSTRCELVNVLTQFTGRIGLRLRFSSKYNEIKYCTVTHTGLDNSGNGEAIYIGTAADSTVEEGLPLDRSDFNLIHHNTIGPGVTAENVDITEGTTGGKLYNNQFNGSGECTCTSARRRRFFCPPLWLT